MYVQAPLESGLLAGTFHVGLGFTLHIRFESYLMTHRSILVYFDTWNEGAAVMVYSGVRVGCEPCDGGVHAVLASNHNL